MRARTPLLAFAFAASGAACNLIAGIQTRDLSGTTGASSAGGASLSSTSSAGGASASSSSGTGGVGPCGVLYVSVKGDDANDGCENTKPKRTIQDALSAASLAGTVDEIRVCVGQYKETKLIVHFAVSLTGGLDCTTWGAAMNGAETVVETTTFDPAAPHTLELVNSGITNAQTIQGFHLKGPASGTVAAASAALWIGSGAAPHITRNVIEGGGTDSSASIASTGLWLDPNSPAEVDHNTISGGTGSSSKSTGSVGLYIGSQSPLSPSIHDNIIDGGSGQESVPAGGLGSVGLEIAGQTALTIANGHPIQNNTIRGGKGVSTDGDGQPTQALKLVNAGDVDVVANLIDGGTATTGATGTTGVQANGPGHLHFVANRINGGATSSKSIKYSGTRAMVVSSVTSLVVVNNEMHGGDSTASGGQSPALWLDNVMNPVIAGNTLAGGATSNGASAQIQLRPNVKGAVLENNLLAGLGDAFGVGVEIGACGAVGKFENNVVFNDYVAIISNDGSVQSPCKPGPQLTMLGAETELKNPPGTVATGNWTLLASAALCGTDTRCSPAPACTDAKACLKAVFAKWDDATYGISNLVIDGWKLGATTPCVITQDGLDLSSTYTDDLFGTKRTLPFSIGACEQDGKCQ